MDSQSPTETSAHDPSISPDVHAFHPASVAMVRDISPPPDIPFTANVGDGSPSQHISSLSVAVPDENEIVIDIPADEGFVTPSHVVVDIPADEGLPSSSHVIVDIPALPSSSHVIDIPPEITHALSSTAAGVQNVDPITPSSRDPITPSSHTVPVISDEGSESRHSSDLPRDISATIVAGPPNSSIPPPLPDYVCVCLYMYISFSF